MKSSLRYLISDAGCTVTFGARIAMDPIMEMTGETLPLLATAEEEE